MKAELPVRVSARVVLFDARDRVVLVLHPDLSPTAEIDGWWVPPGGGVEPGETLEQAAVREVAEEVGIDELQLGPQIWVRRIVLTFNDRPQTFEEHFFLARVDIFDLVAHVNADAEELIADARWWTVDEIEASSSMFAPRDLASLLRSILTGHIPAEPLLVDL